MDWIEEPGAPVAALRPEEFAARKGAVIAQSRRLVVSQDLISAFGRLTGDEQFIHMDPERARSGPFGGTIAHGFLTLSLFSALAYDCLPAMAGATASVNYGFDRVRMIRPVRAGEAISARFTLLDMVAKGENTVMLRYLAEIGGAPGEKPAVAAEWLVMHMLGEERETRNG